MDNTKNCTLDEMRRIMLPFDQLTALGWKKGDRIFPRLTEGFKALELRKTDDGMMQIDELNRVTLHEVLCDKLKLNINDALTTTTHVSNAMLILARAVK